MRLLVMDQPAQPAMAEILATLGTPFVLVIMIGMIVAVVMEPKVDADRAT